MTSDWLDVAQPDDEWLDEPVHTAIQIADLELAQSVSSESALPAKIEKPSSPSELRRAFEDAWLDIDERQRVFLNMLRECRFNVSKASRVLASTSFKTDPKTYRRWQVDPKFVLCLETLRTLSAADALNPEKLILRQEDAVEQMLTPKAILHMGNATGYFETNAGGAAKANETLMKVAGMLKGDAVDVNVQTGPSLVIQVVQPDGNVIEQGPRYVEIPVLPGPQEK